MFALAPRSFYLKKVIYSLENFRRSINILIYLGYLQSYGKLPFKIKSVNSTRPVTYTLQDMSGNIIEGSYYENELQKVVKPE